MRFCVQNQKLKTAVGMIVPLFLVSCIDFSGPKSSPDYWTRLQTSHEVGSCPKIEGVYHDSGENLTSVSGRPCAQEIRECESLINNFLFDARLTLFPHPTPRSSAHAVQIVQPSSGVVEVIAMDGGEKQTLSLKNGDFTCDGDGLRLREKSAILILVMSNLFSKESRIFNVEDDGSLIMKAEWTTTGHHTFIPATRTAETWVRWTRIPPNTSRKPDPQPQPQPTGGSAE